MSAIRCFLLEPVPQIRRSLRRYVGTEKARCDGPFGYHNASTFLDVIERPVNEWEMVADRWDHQDPRWPERCSCGYRFTADDPFQVFTDRLYRRTDTGEILTLCEAPPGAMWYADWASDVWAGPDGRCLVCRCPDGHDWTIDGPANNCTMPDEKTHRCWVRHGTPPNITVDKNGLTCQAGAGSIATGKWHGFLRNGELVVA